MIRNSIQLDLIDRYVNTVINIVRYSYTFSVLCTLCYGKRKSFEKNNANFFKETRVPLKRKLGEHVNTLIEKQDFTGFSRSIFHSIRPHLPQIIPKSCTRTRQCPPRGFSHEGDRLRRKRANIDTPPEFPPFR